jgi:hypothetical protein
MKRIIPFFFLLLLLLGCTSTPNHETVSPASKSSALETPVPGASTPVNPAQPQSQASPAATGAQALPTGEATQAILLVTGTPGFSQTNGSLTVAIFSESDVEVTEPRYRVSGTAPAGTVVSIGDDIIVVDRSQVFELQVPLDEGPNLIEIVASDASGQEVNFLLTVTYIP